jgi:hypothetical protein
MNNLNQSRMPISNHPSSNLLTTSTYPLHSSPIANTLNAIPCITPLHPTLPIQFPRNPKATQRLAKVRLRSALLLGSQRGGCLGEIGVCSLDEGFDGVDDAGGGLALEGLGFEGLDDEGEDFGGLGEDCLVLSVEWGVRGCVVGDGMRVLCEE